MRHIVKGAILRARRQFMWMHLFATLLFVAGMQSAWAGVYFVQVDHVGAPRVVTDVHFNELWRAKYDPFGQATLVKNAVSNNVRLPGQFIDGATNLHYNYFRDYDPAIGRYLQSDPVGLAGGINSYVYAYNNPLSYVDPDGLTGNSSQRRGARRANPPPIGVGGKVDDADSPDLPVGAQGLLCAASTLLNNPVGCLDPELFVCTRLLCTPKCGEPYYIDTEAKERIYRNSKTKCVCIQTGLNRKYDKPLPGL